MGTGRQVVFSCSASQQHKTWASNLMIRWGGRPPQLTAPKGIFVNTYWKFGWSQLENGAGRIGQVELMPLKDSGQSPLSWPQIMIQPEVSIAPSLRILIYKKIKIHTLRYTWEGRESVSKQLDKEAWEQTILCMLLIISVVWQWGEAFACNIKYVKQTWVLIMVW